MQQTICVQYLMDHPAWHLPIRMSMERYFERLDKAGTVGKQPYVHFSGGQMALSAEILAELRSRLL